METIATKSGRTNVTVDLGRFGAGEIRVVRDGRTIHVATLSREEQPVNGTPISELVA